MNEDVLVIQVDRKLLRDAAALRRRSNSAQVIFSLSAFFAVVATLVAAMNHGNSPISPYIGWFWSGAVFSLAMMVIALTVYSNAERRQKDIERRFYPH